MKVSVGLGLDLPTTIRRKNNNVEINVKVEELEKTVKEMAEKIVELEVKLKDMESKDVEIVKIKKAATKL